MVESAAYIADKANYTDMQVLQSPAGYYIGTMYEEKDNAGSVVGGDFGSRDSEYFATREAAEQQLKILENLPVELAKQFLRENP